ncbi:MAG: hydroxymethylbilane synthase [Rhodospirillaceae bacterium]|nr:hydroxymethylbilane synthase [Rhodospirillaceae bacterium]|tara:strand:- start:22831 stop:23769 length:939 start_codon:yes stop_codon:yes gene_type:complete
MSEKFRIATRGSPLALAQANLVKDRLAAVHSSLASDNAIEILPMRTSGDKIQVGSLASAGGKGLFTKEIEDALLEDRADIAVHSMKDVPTILPEGLTIGALLEREDPRDALIACDASIKKLADLPTGAFVGTASLRRKAILLNTRPDVRVDVLRGNVETRLDKIVAGDMDATFLAVAGLRRLGLADRITAFLEPDEMLPAVCQGAIGIECREDDTSTCDLLAQINHQETEIRTKSERAFLGILDGSCRTPIGGLATIDGSELFFRGLIVRPDGSEVHAAQRSGNVHDAIEIGIAVAEELRSCAGADFFDDIS